MVYLGWCVNLTWWSRVGVGWGLAGNSWRRFPVVFTLDDIDCTELGGFLPAVNWETLGGAPFVCTPGSRRGPQKQAVPIGLPVCGSAEKAAEQKKWEEVRGAPGDFPSLPINLFSIPIFTNG